MTRTFALLTLLGACGRVGFDPTGAPGGDDTAPADSRVRDTPAADPDGMSDGPPDAPSTACQAAIMVGVGRTAPLDTCAKSDLVDGCATAGTKELVFEFVAPTSRGYNFSARDPGTDNISHSTARVDATCSRGTGSCAGLMSFAMTAGDTVYFVVEATGGGCAMIQFDVQ